MADRAFVTSLNIQPAGSVGVFSMIAMVTYYRDTGENTQVGAAFDFTFGDTVQQILTGLVANIRAVAVDSGYDVSANGSILMPEIQKV